MSRHKHSTRIIDRIAHLHFDRDMSAQEIADATGMTKGTVSGLIQRYKQKKGESK